MDDNGVIGFEIDNVGDQPDEKGTFQDPIIGNVFRQFLQEKLNNTTIKLSKKPVEKKSAFDKFSENMDFTIERKPMDQQECKQHIKNTYEKVKINVQEIKKDEKHLKQVMAKSIVLQPGFEELKSVPSQVATDKKLKLQRKLEREKTKGKKWFNMPATELTEEVKKDLQVLQMRSVLDPKHFYKKNDLKVLPKYFQVGKVEDSPLDFYNNRLTKKKRKRTLVDELLADAEFAKYNKKKYNEVLVKKQKTHYRAHREAKRLKKKKK